MKHFNCHLMMLCLACTINTAANSKPLSANSLPEVIVSAELLESSALELPNSVTVLKQSRIEQHTASHLENLLNLAPNVNFSTGASRGRFIQIRGIGERSEFQEPINNSVGLIMDGIDMTGIATAASTLDIQQVEILRGPQGTLFGANALAGLINMVSNQPSNDLYTRLAVSLEEYHGTSLSTVISNVLSDSSGYRFAIKSNRRDGYIDNVFLHRDNTNNIDETTARGIISWQPNNKLKLDFTVFIADIDNGYEAFSLDNNRNTYSDQPGHDRQKTKAGAIKLEWDFNDKLSLQGNINRADSQLEYGYDEDWSHTGICDNTACDSGLFGFDWWYSSFDNYQRDNDNTSFDIRLISSANNSDQTSWVLGAYLRDQSINLQRAHTYLDNDFKSYLDTTNTALYGQINWLLSDHWSSTTGVRFEQRDVNYNDSNLATASPDEDLWGGRLAIEYKTADNVLYYALISRGYKPGGFNLDGTITATQRTFDTETMMNYEVGIKRSLLDNRFALQTSLFYQDRDDIQTKQSIVTSIETGINGDTCPCSFTDFTDNAASGKNYGVELEFDWFVSDRLNIYGSAGLLQAEFDQLLSFEHVEADRDNAVPYNLKGRQQAHAPSYQAMLGSQFAITDQWQISGSIEAKDKFYFSDRHQQQSDSYQIANLEIAYQQNNWRIALYGKNITNEDIKTRGFASFGNDPRKFYQVEPYFQFAAPRVIGIKASYEFN